MRSLRSKISSKRVLICPNCGKSTNILIDNLCKSCYYKKQLEKIPGEITVEICKYCQRFKSSPEKIILKYIKKFLGESINFELIENEDSITLKILIDKEYEIEKNILINYELYLCHNCYLSTASFYEAILQIRGENWKYVADIVKSLIQNLEEKKGKKLISEETIKKEGIDLRIMSKKVAEQIVKIIQDKYKLGYLAAKSRKFRGIDRLTSKPKLKFTYLIRTYDIPVGSIIKYKANVYIVKGIEKEKIILQDVVNDNIVVENLNNLKKSFINIDIHKANVLYTEDNIVYMLENNEIITGILKIPTPQPEETVGYIVIENKKYVVKNYEKEKEKINT